MSPDSNESRIGRLEQQMAKAESRLDGHMEKLQEHESDIRAFAPLTATHAVLTEQIITLQKTTGTILRRLDAQDAAREADKKERDTRMEAEQAQRERQREDERRDARNSRRTLYGGMVLVALSSLGGWVIQLLTQAP